MMIILAPTNAVGEDVTVKIYDSVLSQESEVVYSKQKIVNICRMYNQRISLSYQKYTLTRQPETFDADPIWSQPINTVMVCYDETLFNQMKTQM
jgi:hypothetical protein